MGPRGERGSRWASFVAQTSRIKNLLPTATVCELDSCRAAPGLDGRGARPHTGFLRSCYSCAFLRRSEFVITETELKLMAAAAKMGLSRMPKNG